ncbi:MAG TPA: hypothetical protein VFI06_06910 [Chitinophagaceae bacterium]|nr:hypothetical protein [Chitinophagaceae bacterium]
MKRILIYSLLPLLVFTFACRKSDNPKIPELTRVPVMKLATVPGSDPSIDVAGNPANFKANFNVDMLFPEDQKPAKVDVMVRKNGNGAVKVVKTDVASFPTNVQVTGQQLIDFFGPIVLGDFFDFGVDIYLTSGLKIQAFPATGVQYSGGTVNIPTSSPTLRYAAICKYDPNTFQGNFRATDAFGDADGATIVLTKVDDTHFSFIYPSVLNPVPIVVAVNVGNNNLTIPLTTIGSNWSPAFGYPNTALYVNPSVNSATGTAAPCDRRVTLNINWGSNAGALTFPGGPYSLVLNKL